MKTKTTNTAEPPPLPQQIDLSQAQKEQLLIWLASGMPVDKTVLLFEQEHNLKITPEQLLKLWLENARQLHLLRRNYFARIAETLAEHAANNIHPLDSATIYLLKQSLFEALIEPERDPKKIESLIKSLAALKDTLQNPQNENPDKPASSENHTQSLDSDTLLKIEELLNIL